MLLTTVMSHSLGLRIKSEQKESNRTYTESYRPVVLAHAPGQAECASLVSGAFFVTTQPAVTYGLSDRGETRDPPDFQCPGQRSDRAHSSNGPEPFDLFCQQRI